jgi:hypothetical protein
MSGENIKSSGDYNRKIILENIDRIEAVDDVMGKILKQKSPLERLEIAFGLWRSARKQLFFYLRSLHPDWDDAKIHQEVVKRISHGAA